jgi:hypothetical protein
MREEILPNGVLSDLSIKQTERTDSALFTCEATNAFGIDDTSISLIIQGLLMCTNLHDIVQIYSVPENSKSILKYSSSCI